MTNTKHTKKALLMSMLSMLICIAMLIGSTFAWFTDSVTSGRNQIVAGNLDVDLEHKVGDAFESAQDATLFNVELWEPGVMAYEQFKVVNKGSLALKYILSLVIDEKKVTYTKDGKTLADVIKIGVIDEATTETLPSTLTREALAEKIKDAGLLKDFDTSEGLYAPNGGKLEKDESTDAFTVVLYWEPGDNDNDYNLNNGAKAYEKDLTTEAGDALTIGFETRLYATQVESESDSFGNDYDKDAPLPIVDDTALSAAVSEAKEGDVLQLAEGEFSGKSLDGIQDGVEIKGAVDADGNPATEIQIDKTLRFNKDNAVSNVVFSGEGELAVFGNRRNMEEASFTIENCTFKTENSKSSDDIISFMGSGSIKGCTFESKGSRGIGWSYAEGEVIIEDCTFNMPGCVAIHFDGVDGGSVSIVNCSVEGSITIGGGVDKVDIKDSVIDSLLDVYSGDWTSSGNTYKGSTSVLFEDDNLSFTSTDDNFLGCAAFASGEVFTFAEDVNAESVNILVDGKRPDDLIKN